MVSLVNATPFEFCAIWSVLGIAILGLGYALLFRSQILQKDRVFIICGYCRSGLSDIFHCPYSCLFPVCISNVLKIAICFIHPGCQFKERRILKFQRYNLMVIKGGQIWR